MIIQWLPPAPRAPRGPEGRGGAREARSEHRACFPFQWNMVVTRANAAWKVTKQGKNTLVCILDTGIDPTHIDLQGRVDLNKSVSFVATEPEITDFFFHGTAVSSLITSNGLGIASVAPADPDLRGQGARQDRLRRASTTSSAASSSPRMPAPTSST